MLYILLLFILAAQAPPPRDRALADPPDAGSASIAGRITEQGSAQPIARAVVTLFAVDRSRRIETTADGDGKYEFTRLRPGDYLLLAGPPELRSTHLNQLFGDSQPSAPVFPRSNLKLTRGELRTGLDIALFRALAIEGRVVSPWDEPMANVEVRLTRANGAPAAAEGHTDDRGSFRLFGLAPGRYRVCAEPHQRVTDEVSLDAHRLVRTCHPGAVSESEAGEVVLTTADVSGIDIRLQAATSYAISGLVARADGTPADGAFVTARLKDRPFGSSSSSARATSGGFVLKGLPAGRYVLTASAGHSASPGRDTPDRIELAMTEVDVTGHLTNVQIALSKARTVAGRIVFEGAPSPAPRSTGLAVQTRPGRGMSFLFSGSPPSAPVADDLSFQLAGIYRMPLVIGVRGLPAGWILRTVRFAGRDITSIAADLGDAPAAAQLEIVLTNRVARGTVRVTTDSGDPVTSCRVVILPADPVRWDGAPWWNEKTPAADGTVELLPQVPGEYLVAALETSELTLTSEPGGMDRIGRVTTRITLREGDNPAFELRLARIPPLDR